MKWSLILCYLIDLRSSYYNNVKYNVITNGAAENTNIVKFWPVSQGSVFSYSDNIIIILLNKRRNDETIVAYVLIIIYRLYYYCVFATWARPTSIEALWILTGVRVPVWKLRRSRLRGRVLRRLLRRPVHFSYQRRVPLHSSLFSHRRRQAVGKVTLWRSGSQLDLSHLTILSTTAGRYLILPPRRLTILIFRIGNGM